MQQQSNDIVCAERFCYGDIIYRASLIDGTQVFYNFVQYLEGKKGECLIQCINIRSRDVCTISSIGFRSMPLTRHVLFEKYRSFKILK